MAIGPARNPFLARFADRRVWVLLLLQLLIPAQAADDPEAAALSQAQAAFERLEREFAAAQATTTTARQLLALKKDNAGVRTAARDCAKQTEPELTRLDSQLAILEPKAPAAAPAKSGDAPQAPAQPAAPLAPAIARELQDVQTTKANLEGRVASCKLLLLSSNELDANITDYLRGLQARQLLIRGPSLLGVLQANLDERERWLEFGDQLAETSSGWDKTRFMHLAGAAAVGLFCLVLGYIVPRRLRKSKVQVEEEGVAEGLAQAVIASAVSFAPILLALTGVIVYVTFMPRADGEQLPFVVTILYSLLTFFAISAGIRALLNPCPPAVHYLTLPKAIAIPLSRRIHTLAFVVLFRWVVQELHVEGLLDDTMYDLMRHIFGLVWVLNFIWVLWLLRRLDGWRDKWSLIVVICLALFGGLVAGWIGYMNLAALVILGVTYTLLLLGLALILTQVFSDLFDSLDAGRYRWQQVVRRSIGLKDGDYVPGLGWLRLVVNLALWLGAIQLLLLVWDPDQAITGDVLRYFTEGFQVAGVTIVPAQLFWAILIFAALLTLTGWFKSRLNSKWLVKTRMEPSAREALVTTFGYVSVGIAIIVALALAGINFANLAIIAGALSVGIGFGLQNIVNNFVSGIIMLVERPVRTGDWIVVGSTEGYVQRISIRTTTIRTFDRADVIVPNSDLISGQVTNWTLGNTYGRAKLQIGVAYGSDVETVIATLLEVAKKHPSVISGNSQLPDPYVLFLDFGDSSLNFELRAVIRDINYRLHVISDLNRVINAEFKKLGIEIPFPQRDVNFRDPLQIQGKSNEAPAASEGANAAKAPESPDTPDAINIPDEPDNE
jgi:small-conductance mechanosensitive channel